MNPLEACRHFPDVGDVSECGVLGGGHIHRTWLAVSSLGRWVVQACNTRVFADIDAVMANTAYLSAAVPETAPVTADDGTGLWRDGAVVWRVRRHVDGRTFSYAELGADQVRALGRGLGVWHGRVAALDPGALVVTLPGFHDPAGRLARLTELGDSGEDGRRIDRFRWLTDAAAAMRSPRVPERVAHFDAKADNFVIDERGGVRAVIDLDTVMPGSWLWDVGDLARSATGTGAEDDAAHMVFDAARFTALLDGYRSEADPLLSDGERAGVALAPLVVTFEQAVRFLTDHLEGDVYYRVSRPGHNLDRCRAQLALLESMADQLL